MPTTLYLVRHAATAANLAKPAKLQGRGQDPPLAPLGVRQAEATRDCLAGRAIDLCACSPLRRAVQTARIIAAPHGLEPQPLPDLTECDVGAWEGLSWEEVQARDPEGYRQHLADSAAFAYPGGESFADVHARSGAALNRLLDVYAGRTLLVVSHHVVNRTYLASLLGLPVGRARQISLENCGISVVTRDGGRTMVRTLNADFHLRGVAA